MVEEADQEKRAQLTQNILVMIGMATAADMSQAGHIVMMDGLRQLMEYILTPEKVEEVKPIVGYA